jgi:predicted nucleic acid-binding protein
MNGVKFLLDTNIIAFRQKYRTKLPDAIIAATAECHQLELLTLDATLAKRTLGEDSP